MQDLRARDGQQATAHIRAHPAFAPLVRKRNGLAWSLAGAMLLIYYGFVMLVAFAPRLMASPVSRTITLGFPLGLGVIVSAVVLTGIYVLRANAEFDRLTTLIAGDTQ